MCRFVAYAGESISPERLAYGGTHSLYRQSWAPRELLSGSVNADGFGAAWYVDGRPIRAFTDRPVWHAPELRPLLASVRSGIVVSALRNATEDAVVDRSSVPPLVLDEWSFTLNGKIERFNSAFMRDLRKDLPNDLYAALQGSSDTETLFLLLVDRLRRGSNPTEAVRDLIEAVRGRVAPKGLEAQLNMVLSTPDRVVVSRFGTTGESNSLYVNRAWPGAPAGGLIASEALDADDGWEPVPHGSIVQVDAAGQVEVGSLQ